MLSLDDPGWQQLRHAYGEAGDVPDMLRTLALSPEPLADRRAEPWHGLWSSLCHQGDVYTASYAALPHIVRIACETRTAVDFSFFLLPAAIEVARATGRGPSLPAQQADAYRRGVHASPRRPARIITSPGIARCCSRCWRHRPRPRGTSTWRRR